MSNAKRRWMYVLAVLMVLVGALAASAQRLDGDMSGEVKDSLGLLVPHAKVTIINQATGVKREVETTEAGTFFAANLLPGLYTVQVEQSGFKKVVKPGVEVIANRLAEVSLALQLGTVTETVTVEAGAEVIQLHTSQLSNTFAAGPVADLPTVGGANGSVLNLATFLPNTTTQLGGTSGTGGSIGGLRGRENNFTLDGANNNDPSTSASLQPVIGQAVQEFTLSTNQFSAEYGNASGGQFNLVTKSGTNELHGSAYWFTINRHFDAADNQEKALIANGTLTDKKRFDFNTGGGAVGGPIIKNKLFLFGAFQYNTQGSQPSAPSSESFTQAGLTLLNGLAVDQPVKDLLAQFPLAPTSTRTITVTNTTTRASAVIPVGPVTAVASSFFTQYDYLINADLDLTKHQLRWRYSKDRLRQPQFGSFPQPEFSAFVATDNRKAIFSDVWPITSRLVNNFNANMSRYQQDFPLTGIAATYPTTRVVEMSSLTVGPNGNFPQGRTVNQYQIADSLSWAKGRHSLKFGGDYRWFTSPSVFLQNQRGQNGYQSLNELINDLVPSLANFTLQGVGNGSFAGNSKNYSMYIQDDVKVTGRLTLNLGLRYEFFGLPKDGRLNALNAVSNLPGTPLIFDVPAEDHNNVGPRVGFAWDPTGSAKWSIRGGFGVAYDTYPFNFTTNSAPPQKQSVLQPNTACNGTLAAPPAWCASFLAGTGGAGFLANGAMHLTFIPPTTQALARSLTGNLMAPMTSPKVMSWSLGVQRELMRDTSLEVRYVGTRAVELPVQIQLNSITAFENGAPTLPTYLDPTQIPAVVPATAPNLQQVFSKVGTGALRRFGAAGFTDIITWIGPVGNSRYHGGSIDFNHRFHHGILARANWTYSRTQDNATNDLNTSAANPRRPENAYNLANEWGRSALDVRHKVTLVWVYDIPKANVNNAFAKAILHGWQYNGTWLWQLGQPITPISAFDSNGNGDTAGDRVIINAANNNIVGTDVKLVCRNAATGATSIGPTLTASTSSSCSGRANVIGYTPVNPTAHFVRAGLGAVTNSGRNIFTTPGWNVWNMSFFKNTSIRERYTVQFRVEMFDVFNHRNYTLGTNSVFGFNDNALSASYPTVSNANFLNEKQFNGGSRAIQLGMKVTF